MLMLNFPENNSHNDNNIQDPSGALKNLQCAVVKLEACSSRYLHQYYLREEQCLNNH